MAGGLVEGRVTAQQAEAAAVKARTAALGLGGYERQAEAARGAVVDQLAEAIKARVEVLRGKLETLRKSLPETKARDLAGVVEAEAALFAEGGVLAALGVLPPGGAWLGPALSWTLPRHVEIALARAQSETSLNPVTRVRLVQSPHAVGAPPTVSPHLGGDAA